MLPRILHFHRGQVTFTLAVDAINLVVVVAANVVVVVVVVEICDMQLVADR